MKKKSSLWSVLDMIKSYWFIVPVVGGFIYTCAVILPQKVEAQDKRISTVESRQQTIEQYIEATEEQKKLIQQSPPGWRWSVEANQYVEWREDPRLKRK